MMEWCNLKEGCRHQALLQCFGDSLRGDRCGDLCDLCSEQISHHAILPRRPDLVKEADGGKGSGKPKGAGGAKRKKTGKKKQTAAKKGSGVAKKPWGGGFWKRKK